METQALKDPSVFPSQEVLGQALGAAYEAYAAFMEAVAAEGMEPGWRYYNDGKAWLCRVCYKKKTVLWLSVWEGYFRVSFFFTGKNLAGIAALPVADKIKDDFASAKPVGRLIPLLVDVSQSDQLGDVLTIAAYKKSGKA